MAVPKLTIKEIEVEVIRPFHHSSDAESINLMLTIVRGPRGRRKLLGEAFTRQVYHPIIHFKVYDEGEVDALFNRFLQQLIHRGYRPLQSRELSIEDRWSSWNDVDLAALDLSSLERAGASEMEVGEERETAPDYPPKASPAPK